MQKRRFITAGVTIAAAAATAHLMQRDAGTSPPAQPPVVAASAGTPAPVLNPSAAATPNNEVTLVALPSTIADTSDVLTSSNLGAVSPSAPTVPTPTLSDSDDLGQSVRNDVASLLDAAGLPTPPKDIDIPPLPAVSTGLPVQVANADTGSTTLPIPSQDERSSFGLSCGPTLTAAQVADGLVNVSLTAPCRANEQITISHDPISFSAVTDALGTFEITVPAMTLTADFTATFEDGFVSMATVDVPSVVLLERVAIVSDAAAGFQIHAREFGAEYGEAGHVWAGAPGMPVRTPTGGGYLLQLGDPTLDDAVVAEVYTYPSGGSAQSGVVRLSVETEITARNCGTDISGTTIEPGANGELTTMSVTVAVPECDAIGEFLVLKNLLRDLRIASNN